MVGVVLLAEASDLPETLVTLGFKKPPLGLSGLERVPERGVLLGQPLYFGDPSTARCVAERGAEEISGRRVAHALALLRRIATLLRSRWHALQRV